MTDVFGSVEIAKAIVHDIAYLKEDKSQLSDIVLLGDRGYISYLQQLDLFRSINIRMETPMRTNQKSYKKQAFVFWKTRKRIEALLSQLCDQFMLRRKYAKSLEYFKYKDFGQNNCVDFNISINTLFKGTSIILKF